MAGRTKRKDGRTKAEKDRDIKAYIQLLEIIKNLPGDSGKAFLGCDVLPLVLEWLEGLRLEKKEICWNDYLDTKR